MTPEELARLSGLARRIRLNILRAVASYGNGHAGGALSMADVLALLYGKEMHIDPGTPGLLDRDRLVLSKGHCGPGLYAALAAVGYFPEEELSTLNQNGTRLPSHCDRNKTPGVDVSTGSLGQGASAAAGLALAGKIREQSHRVFVILGDGECNEGQVWEMVMFAAHQRLDNLVAIVDLNHQQLDGCTADICDMGDLTDQFAAFGWHVQKIDGHDLTAIHSAVEAAGQAKGRPSVIVADTVKGKGWSAIEGTPNAHHSVITAEMLAKAEQELAGQSEAGEGRLP